MLKRRAVHKDMAEANVYAARRLKDMAQSLGGLAKTFGRKGPAYMQPTAEAALTRRFPMRNS